MHFPAILLCLKAHQCSATECLHPSACCIPFLPTHRTSQFRMSFWHKPPFVPHISYALCLMRHTVKVVYGMDSGIRRRLFRSSSSETCPLRYTWTVHCLQTVLPASVSPSLLLLFGVTRRLMVPTGSISCSRTKKQLPFWSLYLETIQHFDFNLQFSVTLWRKRYLWKIDCSYWFLHTKMSQQSAELLFKIIWSFVCRSQWPRGLRRGSAAARILRL